MKDDFPRVEGPGDYPTLFQIHIRMDCRIVSVSMLTIHADG